MAIPEYQYTAENELISSQAYQQWNSQIHHVPGEVAGAFGILQIDGLQEELVLNEILHSMVNFTAGQPLTATFYGALGPQPNKKAKTSKSSAKSK